MILFCQDVIDIVQRVSDINICFAFFFDNFPQYIIKTTYEIIFNVCIFKLPNMSLFSVIPSAVIFCFNSLHKLKKRSPWFSDRLIQSSFDNRSSPLPFWDFSFETSFSSISYSVHLSETHFATCCFVHMSGDSTESITTTSPKIWKPHFRLFFANIQNKVSYIFKGNANLDHRFPLLVGCWSSFLVFSSTFFFFGCLKLNVQRSHWCLHWCLHWLSELVRTAPMLRWYEMIK